MDDRNSFSTNEKSEILGTPSPEEMNKCRDEVESIRLAVSAMDHAFFSFLEQYYGKINTANDVTMQYLMKYYDLCSETASLFMARILTAFPHQRRKQEIELFRKKLEVRSDSLEKLTPEAFAQAVQDILYQSEHSSE